MPSMDLRRRASASAALIAGVYSGIAATGPALAVPLMFPTDQSLVPVAVAGAFVLPALIAALFAGIKRIARSGRALIGLATLTLLGLLIAGYLNPELRALVGI